MKFKVINPARGTSVQEISTRDIISFATSVECNGTIEEIQDQAQKLEEVLAAVIDLLPNKDAVLEKIASLSYRLTRVE